MSVKPRRLLLHLLQRLIGKEGGTARGLQEALRLQKALRFVGLFALTIAAPSLFLAYLGLTSIRAQEQAVMADVQSPAQAVAQVYWRETDRFFGRLENEALKRLRAGESPLDGLKSLHPMLQAAVRLDGEGNLVGPFLDEEGEGRQVLEYLFDPAITRARELEEEEPETAGAAYGERADTWTDRALRGRALLDMARMLSASGQGEQAEQAWRRVEEQFGPVRDPWGFRLGDLARLHLGRLELGEDRSAPLRELVDDLLVARWTVGEGGEAAVARQAVSLLDAAADRDWLAGTRSRIAERSQQLYWTSALLPELQPIVAASQGQGVASGQFHWTLGARALWATTWWNGEQYAFGLDLGTVVSELKDRARSSVGFEEPITAYLIGPTEDMDQDALATRNLAPWLTGWNFVVVPRDPTGLERRANRQRWLRLMVVLFAVTMISLGVVVSFRLVRTELGLARMKSDFAAGVSHELRSPITQIRLKAEALMLGLAVTEKAQQDHYRAIVRESERLSHLVDNVLAYSALERGSRSFRLEPSNLCDTVTQAIEGVRSTVELAEMNLEVTFEPGLPQVHHDPDAIIQCVVNLVSNAAKYSRNATRGDWIGVEVKKTVEAIELAVSDHGIGIAPHDLRQIFDPFFRSPDSLARRQKGTGIGLAITKAIMDGHGGRIYVQSKPDSGSTFTLWFPLSLHDTTGA